MARVFLSMLFGACVIGASLAGADPLLINEAETSCDDLSKLPPTADRCSFAREHCDPEGFVPFVTIYYCHVQPHGWLLSAPAVVLTVGILVLLFRVMGRTADEYFCSILSQLSQDAGLPPRLGGVTLLALGNGAPDLSSAVAAVRSGNYPMALGALSGGCMFVGCVVAGRIITLNGGVRSRGAQIRDVVTQLIAVAAVTAVVAIGKVTYFTVGLLLFLYLAYVAVVAVADISKRAGVDWSVIGHNLALRMQGKAGLTTPLLSQHRAAGDASVSGGLPAGPLRPSAATGSNGHLGPTVTELHPPSYKHSNSGGSAHSSGDAASEVEMMATSQPVSPSRSAPGALLDSLVPLEEPALRSNGAQNGAQRSHTAPPPSAAAHERKHEAAHRAAGSAVGYEELVHMSAQEYRRRALADMAAAKSFYRRRPAPGLDIEGPTLLEGEEYGEESDSEGEGAVDGDGVQLERGEYVPPDLSTLTAQPPPAPAPPRPGHARDLQGRAVAAYHRQVASFKENAPHEPVVKFVEAAISPLMLLIKATIPIVETESYDRFWFLIALAFSPLFICLYLGKLTFGAVALAELLGIAASLVCLVATSHAPETPPFWDFGTGFPIGAGLVALYSFAIAAMWIDMFASEIVGILHFLGILASVNPAVLGVTVLAWGNSLTDFIANTNMAGKSAGGTSMAMTACFAGPLFNMLVGLGLGFWMLLADTKERFAMVTFDPVVLVGCIFAMVNCAGVAAVAVLNGHWLPGRFGWSMIVWYGIYMAVIIVVVTFS